MEKKYPSRSNRLGVGKLDKNKGNILLLTSARTENLFTRKLLAKSLHGN